MASPEGRAIEVGFSPSSSPPPSEPVAAASPPASSTPPPSVSDGSLPPETVPTTPVPSSPPAAATSPPVAAARPVESPPAPSSAPPSPSLPPPPPLSTPSPPVIVPSPDGPPPPLLADPPPATAPPLPPPPAGPSPSASPPPLPPLPPSSSRSPSHVSSPSTPDKPTSPTPANPSSPTPVSPAPPSPATPSPPSPTDPFSPPPANPAPPGRSSPPTLADPSPPTLADPSPPTPANPSPPSPRDTSPSTPTPANPSPPTPADPSPPTPRNTSPPTPADPSPPTPRNTSPPTPADPSPPTQADPSPPTPADPSPPTPRDTSPPTQADPPSQSSPSPPALAKHPPSLSSAIGSPPPPDPQRSSTPSPWRSSPNQTHPLPSSSPLPPLTTTIPAPSNPPATSPAANGSFPMLPLISSSPADPGPSKDPVSTPFAGLPGNPVAMGRGGAKSGTAAGIAIIITLVVLGVAAVLVWSVRKWRKQSAYATGYVRPSPFNSSRISESSCPGSPTPLVKKRLPGHGFQRLVSDHLGQSKPWFSYEELLQATHGFSSQNLLGEGGFGSVYKGRLLDGRAVAVKQLRVEGGRAEREFQAEVEIISRVHHRHLVSLVGCCISDNLRLLVYDYVPNNTLHYHLHGTGRPVMDWATRLKVALGAARGVAYLHEDCHPQIIHRDIKSSNILLDNNFEARVSDFGLAKLAMDTSTQHVTTRLVGTFGYLAPEYVSSGKLSAKSDVFSFGVVILELITGREPVDSSRPLGSESLVEWARPLLARSLETGELGDLPDPKLEKSYNPSEARRMIEVAASCIRHSAPMRPQMGQVVRALDGSAGPMEDLSNGVRPGRSELLGPSWPSAEIRLFQQMAFGGQDHSGSFGRGRQDL